MLHLSLCFKFINLSIHLFRLILKLQLLIFFHCTKGQNLNHKHNFSKTLAQVQCCFKGGKKISHFLYFFVRAAAVVCPLKPLSFDDDADVDVASLTTSVGFRVVDVDLGFCRLSSTFLISSTSNDPSLELDDDFRPLSRVRTATPFFNLSLFEMSLTISVILGVLESFCSNELSLDTEVDFKLTLVSSFNLKSWSGSELTDTLDIFLTLIFSILLHD